jgi:hypothetical protein
MLVTYEVGSYNPRRYGKPWIALVRDWPIGKNPVLEFGGHVDAYTAEIDAPAGALVKIGQKDHRGRGTDNDFAIVRPDGTLDRLTAKDARAYWLTDEAGRRAYHTPTPDAA